MVNVRNRDGTKVLAVFGLLLVLSGPMQVCYASSLRDCQAFADAAKRGNLRGMEELVAQGMNVNEVLFEMTRGGPVDCRALHLSAERGHKDCVEFLLSHGADPCITDGHSATALGRTARAYMSCFRLYGVKCGDGSSKEQDNKEFATFHMVKRLFDITASCSSLPQDTDIFFAALILDDCEWFKECWISSPDTDEDALNNLMFHAFRYGSERVAMWLMVCEQVAIPDSAIRDIALGSTSFLRMLVDKGFDLNTQDEIGRTALHYAVEQGYWEMVQVLLQLGASPHLTDSQGHTPEVFCGSRKRKEILKKYLSENEQRDSSNTTPETPAK